jgi:tetratricopeptide (TPR) repeat protein
MASLSEALSISFDYYAAGRFTEAVVLCRRILEVAPDQAAAAQVAGAALAALGQNDQAAAAFRLLLILRPADGGGWSNLGNVESEDERGLKAFTRALVCDFRLADACANRAARLTRLGRKGPAAAAARAALVRAPDHDRAMVNLADALIKNDAASVDWARRACFLVPISASARVTLAASLAGRDEMGAAARAAQTAAASAPTFAAAYENLALAQAKLGNGAATDRALARATSLGAGPQLSRTAASAYLVLARPDAALPHLDRALLDAPDDAGLHWNRATALLQAGRWEEGWREFEWRRRDDRAEPPWRDLGVPTWDGAGFPGKRLLLYAEQGLGDAVQMLRFVAVVLQRGGDVVLELQAPLLAAARRRFPTATVIARGAALPAVDLECPLMSLPGLLGVTPDHMPGAVPFLAAEPARAEKWAARLQRSEPGLYQNAERLTFRHFGEARAATERHHLRRVDPKGQSFGGVVLLHVGIVWAGNPRFPDDRRRSPGLAALLGLMRAAPQARFFGLQMGEGRRSLGNADLPENFTDLGREIVDIDDTLAIMAGLDLVISSCTLPAHLAIATGAPLWLLLSAAPDWRWLLDRTDTPWHPRARLFRQTVPGDWTGPTTEMIRALNTQIKNGP